MSTAATEKLSSWTLPAAVQEEYRAADDGVRDMTLRLGTLEAEYVSAKSAVMAELDKRLKARVDVLTQAAKSAGLDVDNEKWTLNVKTMTLNKE